MNQFRQISLQFRHLAMFRGLTAGAATALVFSSVFFGPVFDQKDTIAAAAQTREERGSRDRGSRNERGDRSRSRDRGQSQNQSSPTTDNAQQTQSSPAQSQNGNGSLQSVGGGQSTATQSQNINGSSQNTGGGQNSAAQSTGSENRSNNLIPRRPQFSGDSEPQSEPLSAREEREAIDNGWR